MWKGMVWVREMHRQAVLGISMRERMYNYEALRYIVEQGSVKFGFNNTVSYGAVEHNRSNRKSYYVSGAYYKLVLL